MFESDNNSKSSHVGLNFVANRVGTPAKNTCKSQCFHEDFEEPPIFQILQLKDLKADVIFRVGFSVTVSDSSSRFRVDLC